MLYVSNFSFVIPPYLAKKRLYYTINRLIAVILLKPEIQIKICDIRQNSTKNFKYEQLNAIIKHDNRILLRG